MRSFRKDKKASYNKGVVSNSPRMVVGMQRRKHATTSSSSLRHALLWLAVVSIVLVGARQQRQGMLKENFTKWLPNLLADAPPTQENEQDRAVLDELQRQLTKVHPATASLQFFTGNKSYTINKQKIFMCLKDQTGAYYDMNMLLYVGLHELAHCLCDEVGHTTRFHDIFNVLLHRAHDLKIYDRFVSPIPQYCTYT